MFTCFSCSDFNSSFSDHEAVGATLRITKEKKKKQMGQLNQQNIQEEEGEELPQTSSSSSPKMEQTRRSSTKQILMTYPPSPEMSPKKEQAEETSPGPTTPSSLLPETSSKNSQTQELGTTTSQSLLPEALPKGTQTQEPGPATTSQLLSSEALPQNNQTRERGPETSSQSPMTSTTLPEFGEVEPEELPRMPDQGTMSAEPSPTPTLPTPAEENISPSSGGPDAGNSAVARCCFEVKRKVLITLLSSFFIFRR